jgi:chemotaxis protein MotB
MRRQFRTGRASYDEEGSYLASVSDLMSALIFIFIITLTLFVLSFKQQQDRLTGTTEERDRLLRMIEQRLRDQGETRITVDPDQGVIRFGEAILFDSGRAEVKSAGLEAIGRLRAVLESVLPCYAAGTDRHDCGAAGEDGKVDAVFVEGHTDSQPIRAGNLLFEDNWDLSATRARRVFQELVPSTGTLVALRNSNRQPLFSVSGYAESRPVDETHLDPNRRIDLRFVMVPPPDLLPAPARQTKEGMAIK